MRIDSIITLAVIMFFNFSCHENKLTQTVWYSNGAWNDNRTLFIFLRWEMDYYKPKGLARFPDGGTPKYVRDELFVCVFDREKSSVSVIVPGRGKPRGYPPAARFSWKGDKAVYKIWNADPGDNARNPVVLIDMKTLATREFFQIGEKPELSPEGKRICCLKGKEVWITDIDSSKTWKAADTGMLDPVFSMWNEPDTVELHVNDGKRFTVYKLKLNNGSLTKTDMPYLKHYGNESTPTVLKNIQ